VIPSESPATANGVLALDFDGTITETDSQHLILTHFLGERWREVDDAWRRGEITAVDRSEAQWGMLEVGPEEVGRLLADKAVLSNGAIELIQAAEGRGWDVVIMSDGFRFYIEPLLEKYGLLNTMLIANELRWSEAGPKAEPLHQHPTCRHCANCKLWEVRTRRLGGAGLVMVGDGRADRGAALAAHRVFAKDNLVKYCTLWGIPYEPFESLADVHAALDADGWVLRDPRTDVPSMCLDVSGVAR